MANPEFAGYEVYINEREGKFYAHAPAFPGIMGSSTTKEGAAEELRIKAGRVMEEMQRLNIPLPPSDTPPEELQEKVEQLKREEATLGPLEEMFKQMFGGGKTPEQRLFEAIMGSGGVPSPSAFQRENQPMNNFGQILDHLGFHVTQMQIAARAGDLEAVVGHMKTLGEHCQVMGDQVEAQLDTMGLENAAQVVISEMREWDSRPKTS